MKRIYKQKVKKGFTLVELLGVIAILAVVVTISVPLFSNVKKSTLKKQYKNVVTTIENAAEKYAKETHITTVSVQDLIDDGYLSADDQEKIYNPIDKSSLNCYIVVSKNENGVYVSEFKEDENLINKENNTCKEYKKTSDFQICVKIGDKEDCDSGTGKSWYNDNVLLTVKLPAGAPTDASLINYEWISTVGDSGKNSTLNVNAESLKSATYTVSITYKKDDNVFTGKASRDISIDKQKPNVDLEITDENAWSKMKTVKVTGSDGVGSGIKGYIFINENTGKSCPLNKNEYYVLNSFNVRDIGKYKACVVDNAGNVSEVKGERLGIKLIDKNDPVLEFVYDKGGKFIRRRNLELKMSDVEALHYYEIRDINGSTVVNKKLNGEQRVTEYYTFSNDGTYTIVLYDMAGRSVSKRVVVDTIAPYLISNGLQGSSMYASFNETVYNQVYLITTSSYTPPYYNLSQDGNYYYYSSCGSYYYGFTAAEDEAGNESGVLSTGSYYYSCPPPPPPPPVHDNGSNNNSYWPDNGYNNDDDDDDDSSSSSSKNECDKICQMAQNSEAWNHASAADKEKLHDENIKLGNELKNEGNDVNYNKGDGTWGVNDKVINCTSSSTSSGCK